MKLFAGVEAGGTKFTCAVGTGNGRILAQTEFPTTTPDETIHRAIKFFVHQQDRLGHLTALGIASFGPVDLSPESTTYGFITSTPKPGWKNTDMITPFRRAFYVPVGFDTDVNGAVLAEWRWGAGVNLDTVIYLTIGTGVGGGGIINGRLMHGLMHPEMGHILIPHDFDTDPFAGICSFHGDCLEGLASGPAIEERWGRLPEQIPAVHKAWELEAHYLALGLVNYICTLSPQRIIMGGGVMKQKQLFPLIRQRVKEYLKGYVQVSEIIDCIDAFILPPQLGSKTGVLGALALGEEKQHNQT